MSVPSDRRWRPFSVRPPSDSAELGVADRVEPERRVDGGAEGGRQRPDLVDRGRRPAPDRVADLAGAVRRLAALGEPVGELVRRRARTGPGRGSRAGAAGSGASGRAGTDRVYAGSADGSAAGSRAGGRGGRAGRSAADGHGLPEDRRPAADERLAAHRPAARRLDLVEERAGRRASRGRARAHRARAGRARRRRPPRSRRRPARPAGRRRSRRSCPATAGGPGPGARGASAGRSGSSRPSARRSGRVRLAPSARLRLGLELAGQPRLERPGEEAGGDDREARLEGRRRLVAGQRHALDRDERTGVEAGVHPHQADPRLGGRRRGSPPGSASRRGGAAGATDGG